MKAMILAAGLGTRMRPLTLTTPKPLVQVQGRALIDYHLDALKKAQVSEVVINVHHLGNQIIAHVQQQYAHLFQLHFFNEPEILGTGGGIYQALSVFEDQPFIVISADIFTDYPYAQLPKTLDGLAHLVMVHNPSFHPQGDFYLTAENKLSLHEGSRLTYASIGVFHPKLFAASLNNKFELLEVLLPAIEKKQLSGTLYEGAWENIGTLAQLEDLKPTLITPTF